MISRQNVLDLVKSKGPLVPTDITSELKSDSFIVGAFLSELVSSKEVSISKAKLGGSPLYYVDTQKSGLLKLYSHLNEKDRRAYDALKNSGVILDETQTPLMRTTLRAIPDFSNPFKVTYRGKQFLFWKWYLLSDEIVKSKVKEILDRMYPVINPAPKPQIKLNKPVVNNNNKVKPNNENRIRENISEKLNHKAYQEENNIKKEETIKKNEKPITKVKKQKTEIVETEVQETLDSNYISNLNDEFLNKVGGYLNSLKVVIKNVNIISKNKDLDLIIEVPSSVGNLLYYCKARNKKKSNEGDLAQAFVEGQLKGYPVLYLSPGDIPKKVSSILKTKYKNMIVLKI